MMKNLKNMSLEDKINYLNENKDKLFSNARRKTKRDEYGRIIISKSEENITYDAEEWLCTVYKEGFVKWE